MSRNRLSRQRLAYLFSAAVALSLTACGGGGDGSSGTPAPPPSGSTLNPGSGVSDGAAPPPPAPLKGQVTRNAALQNVLVCLDLNANNACDADEPASARTGADGAYSVDIAKVPAAKLSSSSLIALVNTGAVTDPGTAIDSANPTVAATTTSYVLTRPAGAGGAINPLTTLVQAGVAAGMSEADARKNVAIQLGIAEAKIDNYQDDPPATDAEVLDTARFAAAFVSDTLRSGRPLEVGDQNSAVTPGVGELINLQYTDASNYYAYWAESQAKPAGTPGSSSLLMKAGKYQGTTSAKLALYPQAALTPSGWKMCDDSIPARGTKGNPYRTTTCDANTSLASRGAPQDIAGKAMADVVTAQQSNSNNTINAGMSTGGLIGALGNATFPAGSAIRNRTSVTLGSYINIPDVRSGFGYAISQSSVTTLEQLLAGAQASGANLANATGMLPMGTVGNQSWRSTVTGATSPTSGTVQHYVCDYNTSTQTRSNCVPIGTGTYTITTQSGTRLMRVTGQQRPTAGQTLLFTEVDWGGPSGKWVYQALETKPDLASRVSGTASRLNGPAWAAMKSQLGI